MVGVPLDRFWRAVGGHLQDRRYNTVLFYSLVRCFLFHFVITSAVLRGRSQLRCRFIQMVSWCPEESPVEIDFVW